MRFFSNKRTSKNLLQCRCNAQAPNNERVPEPEKSISSEKGYEYRTQPTPKKERVAETPRELYGVPGLKDSMDGFTKEHILLTTTVWLEAQPMKERERLKHYFLSGINEVDTGVEKGPITLYPSNIVVHDQPRLPPYGR